MIDIRPVISEISEITRSGYNMDSNTLLNNITVLLEMLLAINIRSRMDNTEAIECISVNPYLEKADIPYINIPLYKYILSNDNNVDDVALEFLIKIFNITEAEAYTIVDILDTNIILPVSNSISNNDVNTYIYDINISTSGILTLCKGMDIIKARMAEYISYTSRPDNG